jgi:hypothetical protein
MENGKQPQTLKAFIGGFGGPSYGVRFEDSTLYYDAWDNGEQHEPVEVHPTEADWEAFWRTLDEVGAWDWKEEYETEGVMDGTGWSLEVEYNGRVLETGGSNAYPPDGKMNVSKQFSRFLKAVSKLAGGRKYE